MVQMSLFKQMKRVLKDEYYVVEKEAWLQECKTTKLGLLWEILFETDVRNVMLLESRIYEYGSQIKENDYLHRDIFIWLVTFLNLVIKQEMWYYNVKSSAIECVVDKPCLHECVQDTFYEVSAVI